MLRTAHPSLPKGISRETRIPSFQTNSLKMNVSCWKMNFIRVLECALAFLCITVSADKTSYDTNHRGLRGKEDFRRIAWLMGFPNSGTNYLVDSIHYLTLTSTASNIGTLMMDNEGKEYEAKDDSIPVFNDQPGPSFSTNLPSPDAYVLTRTQGFGTCFNCPPTEYIGSMGYAKYTETNCYANIINDHQVQSFQYSKDLVKKMIILIRNPVDIVVERFFQKRIIEINDENEKFAEEYPDDIEGFRKYCEDMNNGPFLQEEMLVFGEEGFLNAAQDIPCRSEFIKIFHFYNNAVHLAGDLNLDDELDLKIVRYEDFSSRSTEVESTLKFLSLPRINPIPDFPDSVDSFFDFYTPEDIHNLALLMDQMILPSLYDYFIFYVSAYMFQFDHAPLDDSHLKKRWWLRSPIF